MIARIRCVQQQQPGVLPHTKPSTLLADLWY